MLKQVLKVIDLGVCIIHRWGLQSASYTLSFGPSRCDVHQDLHGANQNSFNWLAMRVKHRDMLNKIVPYDFVEPFRGSQSRGSVNKKGRSFI